MLSSACQVTCHLKKPLLLLFSTLSFASPCHTPALYLSLIPSNISHSSLQFHLYPNPSSNPNSFPILSRSSSRNLSHALPFNILP
ncbi:hypothetical protein E2C01_101638 [Portunus trituberculatus]|uniref:Uncharacterized protein n=1 Tax=Portunus trituberculatus TaxID=210409 RepID=A0A5B7KKL7_PORTR|nr:hypothetical protein [Portunus trituberculatus]